MHILILIGAAPTVAAVTAALNWLALIGWRSRRQEHWAEQARRLWPVLVTARSMTWVLPLIVMFTLALLRPDTPTWATFGAGMAGLAGAMAGALPLSREIFPRLGWGQLIRQSGINLCLHLLLWVVFGGVALAMPEDFGWPTFALGVAVVALQLYWARSGWLRIGLRLGLFGPASARLQRIVDEVTAKTGISCKCVWTMRIGICQALALPFSRELVFSDRLLEVMPDDEVAAVCAHELGHLTESRGTLCLRLVRAMAFLPWIFVGPLMHSLGPFGFYIPLLAMVILPRATAAMIQRLETRADKMATDHEGNAGVYARALLRLSEENLTPVVFPGKGLTHPHTYDRVLAAGVTPDFPRPHAPATMAWHGFLLSGVLGVELAMVAMRQLG